MKKSEIMVSMPMTTYEELIQFKQQYFDLIDEIKTCFKMDYFNKENTIAFDTNDALRLCKGFLPDRYKNANFIKTE